VHLNMTMKSCVFTLPVKELEAIFEVSDICGFSVPLYTYGA